MFGGYPWQPQGNQLPYQQQYRTQGYGQPMDGMMDPGALNARYVTCREEAMAAQIQPDGKVNLFVNAAMGRIYTKCFNPNTGIAEFREYGMIQPPPQESVQYAPIDALQALGARVDQIEQMMKEGQPA